MAWILSIAFVIGAAVGGAVCLLVGMLLVYRGPRVEKRHRGGVETGPGSADDSGSRFNNAR
jgi:hypothetical protein